MWKKLNLGVKVYRVFHISLKWRPDLKYNYLIFNNFSFSFYFFLSFEKKMFENSVGMTYNNTYKSVKSP